MKVRPSEYYAISDEVAAWCFDRAVTTFGVAIESDLDAQSDDKDPKKTKANRERRFALWMNERPTFRDPSKAS